MMNIYLYKKGFNQDPADDSKPKDTALVVAADAVGTANKGKRLVLSQAPNATPRLPFVNLDQYALVFSQEIGAIPVIREGMSQATVVLVNDTIFNGVWVDDITMDKNGNPVISIPDDLPMQVLHLDPESVVDIRQMPAVDADGADHANSLIAAQIETALAEQSADEEPAEEQAGEEE